MKRAAIMPNLPNIGFISTLSKGYETLTNDLIQSWLYELYCNYQIDPECIFVSPKGRCDIRRAMESLSTRVFFGVTEHVVDDVVSRYPNYVTGTMLHVVVLPMLPENMLLLGNLVI